MQSTEQINLQDNILQYESFINDVLKEDLRKVIEQRDVIYSKMAEYLQLKRMIQQLQDTKSETCKEVKVMTDLGCNFYCQAKIENAEKVLIAVGFGFFVEFTLQEGLDFIEKKVDSLTKQADKFTSDSASIKARIKVVLSGLKELQMLDFANEDR